MPQLRSARQLNDLRGTCIRFGVSREFADALASFVRDVVREEIADDRARQTADHRMPGSLEEGSRPVSSTARPVLER